MKKKDKNPYIEQLTLDVITQEFTNDSIKAVRLADRIYEWHKKEVNKQKFKLIVPLLTSQDWFRQRGNEKLSTFYSRKTIIEFKNGKFSIPKIKYIPINLTYNEYADLLLFELLMLQD